MENCYSWDLGNLLKKIFKVINWEHVNGVYVVNIIGWYFTSVWIDIIIVMGTTTMIDNNNRMGYATRRTCLILLFCYKTKCVILCMYASTNMIDVCWYEF